MSHPRFIHHKRFATGILLAVGVSFTARAEELEVLTPGGIFFVTYGEESGVEDQRYPETLCPGGDGAA